MVLRRAVKRTRKQRTLKLAIKAALAVAVVGTSGTMAAAQQTDFALPALPDVGVQAQSDFELPTLPTLPSLERRTTQQGRVTKLLGFANRRAKVNQPTVQLPALPVAPVQANTEVTWSSRQPTRARWTVNPHIAAEETSSSEVIAASAEAPADETKNEDSRAITMTISGGNISESLIDVDIPLLLPSYDDVAAAPKPTTPARQPEIVTKKTQIRLTDTASSQPTATLPAQPQATEFSLSDSTNGHLDAPESVPPQAIAPPSELPASPQRSDMVPSSPLQAELPAPPAMEMAPPFVESAPARTVAALPKQLVAPTPERQLMPVQMTKEELPSTTSSRGVETGLSDASQPSRLPMQVVIEGQPARVVNSSDASSMSSSRRLPQPTFDTTRGEAANRYQSSRQSALPSPRPVRAHLASQSTPIATDVEVSESFESSRKSEKARQLPPEALSKMSRLSVVVEQAVPMSVGSSIVQTSVEDPSVCQLIQSGERSLSLVGLKAGSTRVAIVTSQDGSEPKVRVYEVSVGRGAKAEYGLSELAAGIDETLTRLYPSSRIRVSAGEGHLVVSGTADTEEQARRVLALVRRTSLLPVTDKLRTR